LIRFLAQTAFESEGDKARAVVSSKHVAAEAAGPIRNLNQSARPQRLVRRRIVDEVEEIVRGLDRA
jgi:hypothetical protein